MSMYWILFIGIAVISYIVQNSLQSKFKKYSKMPLASGMTGKDVAEKMLHDNGIYDVRVTSTPGMLTDHYNPANKTVNLSEGVYAVSYTHLDVYKRQAPISAMSSMIWNPAYAERLTFIRSFCPRKLLTRTATAAPMP